MIVSQRRISTATLACRAVARLQTLAPRVGTISKVLSVATTKDIRMTGSALQRRRLAMWSANPRCASCGSITQYPYGFQLDHIVPLHKGGEDHESNCQILCVDDFDKPGCHTIKTREDMKQ